MFALIQKLLFPPRCACCGTVIEKPEVCLSCRQSVHWIKPPVCPVCGKELECCRCGKPARFYQFAAAPMRYNSVVRQGIHRFKFQNKVRSGVFFAAEMEKMIRKEYKEVKFDLLCSVPLSRKILIERGYNQCDILCKLLSKHLKIPFKKHVLIKSKENQMQHTLPRNQRFINIRGVFKAKQNLVAGKTVLLIDDIMTTGATLNECAKVLMEAGAKVVYCAVAALVS